MHVEAQITIKKDKAAVWNKLTNIRQAAEFINGIENIEILNEPKSGLIGLKWRETRMYFGKPACIDKWITEAVANEFYKTRSEMDGFTFVTTFTLSHLGSDTLLKSSHETHAHGFMAKMKALPMIFFKGMLKKAILQDLEDIKAAIE